MNVEARAFTPLGRTARFRGSVRHGRKVRVERFDATSGLYGNTTAGQTMTPELVGVAHRTLPCGTQVTIYYAGRTLVVPVVDRGPYHPEAEWDLTAAAAQALGFTGADEIGAQPVSR